MAQDQVSEVQMQARLAKRAALLKEAASVKSTSSMRDDAVVELFGLGKNKKSTTINATFVKCRFGVDKNKNDYFAFDFVCNDPRAAGAQFGPYFSIKGDNEDVLKAMKRIMRFLQDLGFDTASWKNPEKDIFKAIRELNAKSIPVKLSLNIWGTNDDRLDFQVVGLNTEPEEFTQEDTHTVSTEDWLVLGDLADTDESADGDAALTALSAKAEELGVDPNDYPTWVSLAEYILANSSSEETTEETTEEDTGTEPGPHWVGEEATWIEYDVIVQVTDCNEKKKMFTVYSPTDEDSFEVNYTDLSM
jgi:hypothetical protein